MASNVRFTTPLVQCGSTTLAWDGGTPPLRLELYQQVTPASPWNGTGLIYDVYSNEHQLQWQVSSKTGALVWATIVDHTGGYNQSLSPAVVESSSDDSCLLQVVSTRTTTSSRHRSIYVGAILGAFLFLAFLAIIFLLRRLRQTREEMRHRRTSSLDRPRLILDTASSLNANYDDDAATISSFANRESYVDSPTTPSMSHQRHGSLGGSMSMMTEDPFADPMARREASIASFGSTGTAKEHVELATGPLRVRNAMDV